MSMLAVASLRSCGATTLACGLASVWPAEPRPLLVEADPAGGTLAATTNLPAEPGLGSVAAALRRGGDADLLAAHARVLPCATAAVTCPAEPSQAASVLAHVTGLLAGCADSAGAPVLVDCGRLDPGSPVRPVFDAASLRLLAVRPRIADLLGAAETLRHDTALTPTGIVLIGPCPYPAEEVADALGVPVLAQLPWDAETAQALPLVPAVTRQVARTPLVRALRSLATDLAHHLQPAPAPQVVDLREPTSQPTGTAPVATVEVSP
jgi:hypothetical protein